MPDQYGRPTFNDGMQIYQGLEMIKRDQRAEAGRQTEQQAYEVADTLSKKGDISGFSPEAKYKGVDLFWKGQLQQTRAQKEESLKSKAGMDEKMGKIKLNNTIKEERWKRFNALANSGDPQMEKEAKKLAVKMFNENMYNGYNVDQADDGFEVTSLTSGEKSKIPDMDIEKIRDILGQDIGKSPDEIMKHSLGAEMWRSNRNSEILSKSEQWEDAKGNIILKVPRGTIDPKNGKLKGEFFTDIYGQSEISPEQVKNSGFQPVSIGAAKRTREIQAATLDRERATTAKTKADTFDPGKAVVSGGKTGLIMQGEGGKPTFTPIQGGAEGPFITKGSASSAKSGYELKVKQLQTELMPFISKGGTFINPDTMEITTAGQNAIKAAMELVQKAQTSPDKLTPQERSVVPNAKQAVLMYQAMSKTNAADFGINPNDTTPAPKDWRQYVGRSKGLGENQ